MDVPVEPASGTWEARFRTLFELAQVGVVLADARSYYLDANPTACRMFGYSRDEFVGLHASDIVVALEAAKVEGALDEIRQHADHRREWRFRRKDGSIFPGDVIATAMPDGTLLGVIRDVSDRRRAEDYRERLAAIVESSTDAIVGEDLDGTIISWNAGAEAMFGYPASEMVGRAGTPIVPDDRRDETAAILARIRRGERVEQLETRRCPRTGPGIDVSITVSPIRDSYGRVAGASTIARDVSVLKARERELARVSALYAALSQINHAIVFVPTPEELCRAVCRALVEQGGFALAWIGWHDPETHRLVAVADCGDAAVDLRRATVYGDDRPEGRGTAGTAFRSGRAHVCNDLNADPGSLPWRETLARRGLRSSAALPIRADGEVRGVLSVYADRRDVFHDREVALLEETATALSFGLDNFAREDARRRAETAGHSERLFSDAMIDSMPGVVYLYDVEGRFLRWNRNFETVSGYTGAEIHDLHPLDFFTGDDRSRVEARIAEVFATGESSVDAALVTRSGARVPHFFTGRRVVFEGRTCLVGVGIDVSERRLAEARLAASERQYRELVELASSIILRWDADGRVTFLNEFGQRFFGYVPEDIVGRLVTETIVPPADSTGRDLTRLMDRLRAAPEAFTEQVNENVRRSGERVWISWSNRVVRDGEGRLVEILSIGADVTERRRAELRLRESEAHLVEAQRIARVGSWALELQTGKLTWSDQVYEMFGIDRTAFDGTMASLLAAVHPDDRERTIEAHRAARDGTAMLDFEHRVVLPSGDEKVVHELASLKRDEAGRPVLLSGTVHDITDRVRMEQERERRHRAEAADRIKSAFLATMSHELRTPLNSIIGFTGILLQGLPGPLNGEQHKQLEMVRGSARHLLALVNDVLDISKIEAGQLEIGREPFEPDQSIARVVALVAPQAAAKGLDVRVGVVPGLGPVIGDARRFEQILLNLLSNAIKFTEHGGVSLTATTGHGGAGPTLVVAVADTGIGIRAEHLPALFQPFRQIEAGLARTYEGTGLGLAICDRLAKLMGGSVAVDSHWGRGSTFTVTVPLMGAAGR